MTSGSELAPRDQVRLAEVCRDLQHVTSVLEQLAKTVNHLRGEFKDGQERQTTALGALRQHLDERIDNVWSAASVNARELAVHQAQSGQWQDGHEQSHTAHDQQHQRDHSDQSRKTWAADALSAIVAALVGIWVQPGGGP